MLFESVFLKRLLCLKLTNGEEIVGMTTPASGQPYYQVENPYRHFFITSQGHVNSGLIPWFLSSDDSVISINASQIIAVATPSSVVQQMYHRLVTQAASPRQEEAEQVTETNTDSKETVH